MERVCGMDVLACERCPALVESRSRIVNGAGPTDADIVFVGEAPGEQEDSTGEPFVGRSGQLLTEALAANGLTRDDVRISNSIRCRPADNRDPHREELANCRPYLESEIEAIDPQIIVTLGKVPSEHLLERSVAVTKEAGNWETQRIGGTDRDIMICVHPAAGFYDPTQLETLEQTIGIALDHIGLGDDSAA